MNKIRHNYIDRAEALKNFQLENLQYVNGKISLIDKTKKGIITSPIYTTVDFKKLTASWVAQTNETSSIEVKIKVIQDNKESKYFSYGVYKFKGENLYYDQDDTFSYMSVDEVIVKESKTANGFRYQVEMTNDTKLSLICVALKIDNYKTQIDTKGLPSIVDYDVPKLNQNIVPVIGNEMCSATTTCMLLKWKGEDFKKYDDTFEHRYVASLVADRGHNSPTFGNWVYNTAVIGEYGYNGYVCRMYSWEELKYHLAKVGPVGASIAGDTTIYKTNGHLLVVRGYKEVDGKTYVLINDPNINERFGEGMFVYHEFPLEVFMNFWRGVAYVIE